MKRITVVGLGNVLMGDDALGPYAVRVLEAGYEFPAGTQVLDLGTPGLDLQPYITGLDALILVDTVSSKGEPGEVRTYRKPDILRHAPQPRLSPHDPGVKEALLTAEFEGTAPAEVYLVGVIPGSSAMGTGLTPGGEGRRAAGDRGRARGAGAARVPRGPQGAAPRAGHLVGIVSRSPAAAPWSRGSERWRRLDTVLVVLVSLHSLVVGSMLLFATGWALRFGGWANEAPHFFVHQGAAFHFVVVFGYLHEYFRHRGISLMVAAKSFALVFLLVEAALNPVPWAVPVSGVLDGLMALVVLLVHRRAAWPRP